MEARSPRAVFVAVILAVACAGMVTLQRGGGVLIVGSVVGAVVGVWALVYARTMCACEPLKVPDLWRAAVTGALSAPGVLLLEHAFGSVVWMVLALAALGWAAAVSDGGHLHRWRPRRDLGRVPGETQHT